MKVLISQAGRENERNFKAPALLRIYIDKDNRTIPGAENNNRPGMKDIARDILWRRQVDLKSIAKNESFQTQILAFMKNQPAIKGYLEALPMKNMELTSLHFGFSRFTGCSMCPCSPGIVVQFSDYGGIPKSFNIWVILEDDLVPEIHREQEV